MAAGPVSVVTRLYEAMNAHDLDAFVACISPNFRSEQPAHPNRAFSGYEQVLANWGATFASVPDFRAELVRIHTEGNTVWSEWAWNGQRQDGSALDMRGVILFGIDDDLIVWARLYMDGTERNGVGIDETIRRMTGTHSQP